MNTNEFYRSERTIVDVKAPPWRVHLGEPLFALGSCFAEHFQRYCHERFLSVDGNPFGPLYNPCSLAESVHRLVENRHVLPGEIFRHRGLYRHFAFHSATARPSRNGVLSEANARITAGHRAIREAALVVVTLGTAFVYRDRHTGHIVNNCHTLPAGRFDRERLTTAQAVEALEDALKALRRENPSVRVVLSVSPVRHLRDAPEENSLSKAILRCAAEELCERADCVYFPAFEILLDELRDYRYYADDLSHPTHRAADYIVGKMIDALFDDRGRRYVEDVKKLVQMGAHRARHPESPEHARFLKRMGAERSRLADRYAEVPRLRTVDNGA